MTKAKPLTVKTVRCVWQFWKKFVRETSVKIILSNKLILFFFSFWPQLIIIWITNSFLILFWWINELFTLKTEQKNCAHHRVTSSSSCSVWTNSRKPPNYNNVKKGNATNPDIQRAGTSECLAVLIDKLHQTSNWFSKL